MGVCHYRKQDRSKSAKFVNPLPRILVHGWKEAKHRAIKLESPPVGNRIHEIGEERPRSRIPLFCHSSLQNEPCNYFSGVSTISDGFSRVFIAQTLCFLLNLSWSRWAIAVCKRNRWLAIQTLFSPLQTLAGILEMVPKYGWYVGH